MGSQTIAPVTDTRRVLDSLRWIVRDLRLAQASGPEGLSTAQAFVLEVLRERGPLTVGELALATATDPSSVSVVVHKLEEKGLVAKAASPLDRRRQVVNLTAAGSRTRKGAPAPAQFRLLERLEALEPEERRRLAELLERIAPPEAGEAAPMFLEGR